MKKFLSITLALVIPAAAALAHHPFDVEFNVNAPVTLKGKVTKVDWIAPHVMIHADVSDANGQTKNWTLEAAGPNDLIKNGLTQTMFGIGTEITVHGYI
jgi:hypothetical protein